MYYFIYVLFYILLYIYYFIFNNIELLIVHYKYVPGYGHHVYPAAASIYLFKTAIRHRVSPKFIGSRNCVPMAFTAESPPAQGQETSR